MLNLQDRGHRRLIPERKKYQIPFKWIMIGAIAVILLAIALYFKRIFIGQ